MSANFQKNIPLCFSTNLNLSPSTDSCKKTLCQNLFLKNRTYHLCPFYNTKIYLADRIRIFLRTPQKIWIYFPLRLDVKVFLRRQQKFAKLSPWFWHLFSKRQTQNHEDDCANFCGLLRKPELYLVLSKLKITPNLCSLLRKHELKH